MVKITKQEKQGHLLNFAMEAAQFINSLVNMNDKDNEELYEFENNKEYWIIEKSFFSDDDKRIELSINKSNIKYNATEQPEGSRVYESSYVYVENENKQYTTGLDGAVDKKDGIIINELSFQGYSVNIY